MAWYSAACGCSGKTLLWMYWAVHTFFSAVYLGLSMTSFYSVQYVTQNIWSDTYSSTELSAYRNGLLASCMLGFLIVLFHIVFSFMVLFFTSWFDIKLAWGFMLGFAINTGFFQLLAGLVLNTGNEFMRRAKDDGICTAAQYTSYQATFAFSYILCGTYVLFFLIFMFCRQYVGKQGLASAGSAPAQPAKSYLDMGAMANSSATAVGPKPGGAWGTQV